MTFAFEETEDANMKPRMIVDAAIRRFRAHKIYLRVAVAIKWVNSRQTILQGQRPHARHADILQQIRQVLRNVSCPAQSSADAHRADLPSPHRTSDLSPTPMSKQR